MADDPHPSGQVLATIGRFHLAGEPIQGDPQTLIVRWRGAVASRFEESIAFHGHDGERTVARYPEVQYRWTDGFPSIFAFGDPARVVMAHPWPGTSIKLGDIERRILHVDFRTIALSRAFSRRLVRYRFHAPWLALNQQNFEVYRSSNHDARRTLLDRILVGNLLTMSRAFGGFFAEGDIVHAAAEIERDVPCVIKETSLIGFDGGFVTNLELSDGLAIGRSVSHGFGWFQRTPS